MVTVKISCNQCGKLMVKATAPGLDILQSCSGYASHLVEDIELESLIAVKASIFALKITNADLLV